MPLNTWTKHVTSYQYERDPLYLSRCLDLSTIPLQLYQDIRVQGNAVFIVNGVKEEAWGIAINSELLAKSLLSIFELVWRMAKPVTVELASLGAQ